jgi:pre-rRNA-processing protein TSR3
MPRRLISPGVVLSSEARTYVSPADLDIVQRFGIAGINCSWNRLEEIPFSRMGNGRNQRILPILFAANSVNYGRPFKMNTAEAMAACLYIVGLKEDAEKILEPFGYGPEFIRLNLDALSAYSACSSSAEVESIHLAAIARSERKAAEKELKHEQDRGTGGTVCTDYLSGFDMPPAGGDDDYYYYSGGEEDDGENEESTGEDAPTEEQDKKENATR